MADSYLLQIRTFSRILWFDENKDDPNEPLTPEELHPFYFVLAKENSLISYARIISTTVDHLGNVYKMYGLGDVFTFPESRNKGYGTRVVASATNYIRADPAADVAILLTEPDLENFYKSVGWEPIPDLTLLTGEPDDRRIRDDFVKYRKRSFTFSLAARGIHNYTDADQANNAA